MSPLIAAIWWIMLAVTVFAVVPAVVLLLERGRDAAKSIERYSEAILEAGVAIAGNTAAVAALGDTVAAAGPLIEEAERFERASAALADVLGDGGGA